MTAHALDVVGERWSFLIIRELMFGPKRFTDIKRNLNGLSANMLVRRLEELAAHNVIIHRELPPPTPMMVYELTSWGYELRPAFGILGKWGAQSSHKSPNLPISVNAALLSMETLFSLARSNGFGAILALTLDGEKFAVYIGEKIFREHGTPFEYDMAMATDPNTFYNLLQGDVSVEDSLRAGTLKTEKDVELIKVFSTLFQRPNPFKT